MTAAAPCRPRILIVEDSHFIIMALEAMCDSLGWALVGPARNAAQGLALAADAAIDAALVDVMLGEGDALCHGWGVAAALQARGIPFIFITGHDPAGLLPESFAGVPVVRKPFRLAAIETPMRQLLAAAAAKSTRITPALPS
jgi:CheY-like chemotaxis protein